MDLLYSGISLLCLITMIFYIRRKKIYIKDREGNTEIVSPLDTAMITKAYIVIGFLILMVFYFIFRE